MNKYILAAIAGFVSVLLATTAAYADTPSATPPSQDQPKSQSDSKDKEAKRFDDRKQRILKELDDHLTRLQQRTAEAKQRQSCVKTAADKTALKACFHEEEHGADEGERLKPVPKKASGQ